MLFKLQVELHPLWPQDKLLDFCRSKGIHVTVSCLPDYQSLSHHKESCAVDECCEPDQSSLNSVNG
jgi:diketogulonate reductase-like aldo/keto reductase